LPEVRLQAAEERELLAGLGALELLGRRAVLLDARENRVDLRLELGERVSGARICGHGELAGALEAGRERTHVRGGLLVVDERLGESRGAGTREDTAQHVERGRVGARLVSGRPANGQARNLNAILERQ